MLTGIKINLIVKDFFVYLQKLKTMIENKVFRLNQPARLENGIEFPMGQEIEVVMDVVYVAGFPLPPNVQATTLNWIKDNPSLFRDDTRKW